MAPSVLFTASTYSHLSNFHRPYLAAFRALGWEVRIACDGVRVEISETDREFPLPFEKKMTAPPTFAPNGFCAWRWRRCCMTW